MTTCFAIMAHFRCLSSVHSHFCEVTNCTGYHFLLVGALIGYDFIAAKRHCLVDWQLTRKELKKAFHS